MSGERRRGDALGIGALASFVLSGLAIEKLSQGIDAGGWISWATIALTVGLGLAWLVVNIPVAWRRLRARSRPEPPSDELHAYAEQAERWLVSLGSHAGGMAAVEWYELNEQALRDLVDEEEPGPGSVDDLARINDALEAWYLRRGRPGDLLQISESLGTLAERSGRRDLAELAAVRTATAYRLLGDVEAAKTWLGLSEHVAPRSRTTAALATRRRVERALLHLARADALEPGADRKDAVLNARDRLDDARLGRPGPDLAAEVAIHIDLALTYLYQDDPDGALDHLRPAAAHAAAAGDAGAQAHALELTGVAAWMQQNSREAFGWWRQAQHLFADVDDREGRARCLQHLGSAELVAGRKARGRELLEQSALLRGGVDGHPLLASYLDQAAPDSEPPSPYPVPPAEPGRFRRLVSRWFRQVSRWFRLAGS